MTSAIDPTKPPHGRAYTADVRENFASAAAEITALQNRTNDTTSVGAFGAISDGQKVFLNVSMPVGSPTLNVSMPSRVWAPAISVARNAVYINGPSLYVCSIAGTTAATGAGPTIPLRPGAQIIDGTARWLLLGDAPTTANVFSPADVGKCIAVARQDVLFGWCPWYGTPNGYAAVPTITAYNSPTSVNLSVVGSGTPTGQGTQVPNQSWPYNATPSVVMWGTDNSPMFQDAINNSASVFVPPGNFCFAAQLITPSGTTIYGSGVASNLMPLGVMGFWSNKVTSGGAFIINPAYLNHWQAYQYAPSNPPLPNPTELQQATIGDTNLTIRDLQIDMSASSWLVGGNTVRWYLATHGTITNLKCIGMPHQPYEAPNFIGCRDLTITHNDYENTWVGFSPWGGGSNYLFAFNRIVVPYVDRDNYAAPGLGNFNGIHVNCVGTITQVAGNPGDDQVCTNFKILDNDVYINGSAGAWTLAVGIWGFPDGGGSGFRDFSVRGNRIFCTGLINRPMLFLGSSLALSVTDNIIDGFVGDPYAAIEFTAEPVQPHGAIASLATVAGQSTVTVNWPSHGLSGFWLNILPVLFRAIAPNYIVGGITIGGYYPVIAVLDANTFTFNAGAVATASATVAWPTAGSFAQMTAVPIGFQCSRNQLKDCSAGSRALIDATGIAANISDNQSILTNGAAIGNYLALVNWYGINNQRTAVIQNNTGPTGTGSLAGNSGNNRVCWNPYLPGPILVDADDSTLTSLVPVVNSNPVGYTASSGKFIPSLSFGGSSAGITYRELNGAYTRIGNIVFVNIACSVSNVGSATGPAVIDGLPYYGGSSILPAGLVSGTYIPNMLQLTAAPSASTTPIVYTETVNGLSYTLAAPGTGGATGTYPMTYVGGSGGGASATFDVVGSDAVLSFVIANAGTGGTDGTYQIPLTGAATTAAVASILVVNGRVSAVNPFIRGAGYVSVPTVDLSTVPGLTGASVIATMGAGGILLMTPGAGGSWTAVPTISTSSAAPGLVGASITAAINTTGVPLSLGVVGLLTATKISLWVGPSPGAAPLTDQNFSALSFLRLNGWYFVS